MKHFLDLDRWSPWPAESVLVLHGKRARRVRLQVASGARVLVALATSHGEFPLALVEGRETIQFMAPPDARLSVTVDGKPASGVWFQTVDGDDLSVEASPDEYTRIWQRRPRDLNMERMMRQFMQNAEVRTQQLLEQQARHFSEENARAVEAAVNRGKGDVSKAEQPKPAKPKARPTKPAGGAAAPADKGTATEGAEGGSDDV